jgi:hypothetical protein
LIDVIGDFLKRFIIGHDMEIGWGDHLGREIDPIIRQAFLNVFGFIAPMVHSLFSRLFSRFEVKGDDARILEG